VTFTKDLLERAIKTFLQAGIGAFAAALAVPADFADLSAWRAMLLAAGVGAVAAGLSAVSSLLSRNVGQPGTASAVPVVPPTSCAGSNRV
jgi:hypothetical protein